MSSITSWSRLEPKSDRVDLRSGLEARLYDPLWLLARQWQVGEFEGEDAASPVAARLRVAQAPLTRLHLGPLPEEPTSGTPYDGTRQPLESLVERESILSRAPAPTLIYRCEAGLHFLRLLDLHGVGHYRAAYLDRYAVQPPTEDEAQLDEGERFEQLMGGRAPDGQELHEDLRAAFPTDEPDAGTLPGLPRIVAADRAAVSQAAREWLRWVGGLFSEPVEDEAAWVAERMEYAFAVAAPGPERERVLVAPEYTDGHLDWYSFDDAPGRVLGAAGDGVDTIVTRSLIPTPVSYRGMPSTRWWEFEDAQVNLGAIDAGPDDLLRMVLVNFTLEFGNDWFLLPLEQPVGTLSRIRSLVVTDSFGGRTLVDPYHATDGPSGGWRLFANGASPAESEGPIGEPFLLAPVLAASLQGQPLEEVRLLRDEMANMAWAVERLVERQDGGRLDRFEAYQRQQGGKPSGDALTVAGEGGYTYRLSTLVPDYWTPLLPVRESPDGPAIRLRRGRLLRDDGGEPVAPTPLGRLLEPGRDLRLFEEEVPRAGATVTRAFQLARWLDGSTHLWIGRRKGVGRGEGFSGLRYDLLERVVEESPPES